jgi:hypothetical protein
VIVQKQKKLHFDSGYSGLIDCHYSEMCCLDSADNYLKHSGFDYCFPLLFHFQNIGFNINASHTFSHKKFNYSAKKLKQKFTSPKNLKINSSADEYVFNHFFCPKNFLWPYRFMYLLAILFKQPILFCKIFLKKIYIKRIFKL